MAKGKKYDIVIEQSDATWSAKITRQVTSRKISITKQQQGFATEADARQWAEKQMAELTEAQRVRNERHGKSRREQEQGRQERASRRSERTENLKKEKAAAVEEMRDSDELVDGSTDESDSWEEELKSLTNANADD